MCGIAGFSHFNNIGYDREKVITAICDSIEHRGPDEWGFETNEQITFGHRRLSIVGLSDGKQPMQTADGSVSITFNGEIYNYKELKAELEKDGIKFRTSSDTEVIIYLYKKYGYSCFEKLNGMFALGIWDKDKEELILARDRAGKKPLFYFHKNNEIIFASELKALCQHPNFSKQLSYKGMNKFFTYEYIPTPYTIFEDTWKVEAGEFIVINKEGMNKKFFWNYPNHNLSDEGVLSEDEAADKLEELLSDAIKIRLQADVPVGVFLSGGIDSSLVTALASKVKTDNEQLQSFSIYFKEKSYDESEYIEMMVKQYNLKHHSEYVSSSDMVGLFDKLGSIMDEPMADPSIVPTYFLSKIATKNIKTVIGGDGADEMFAGYPTYVANKLINVYNIIPYPIRSFLRNTALAAQGTIMPTSTKNMSLDFKLRQFLRGVGVASEIRLFKWMAGLTKEEKGSIFNDKSFEIMQNEHDYEDINRYLSRVNIYTELQRLLYLSQKMYMMDDILVKVDRASMANSLEVRAPFLDYRLVEFASLLPERYKLKGFNKKYLLKKVAHKYLPSEIINRPKKGFGIPLTEWLCEDLKPIMLDLLSEDTLKQQGIFDHQGVKTLIDEHLERKDNHRKVLWSLLSFQLWYKEFMQ